MIFLTLVFVVFVTFYLYVQHCHSYWKKRQIPTLKPTFLVGNLWETLIGTKNFMVPVIESCRKFKDYKYIGFYKCLTPTLIINDLELIGQVMVKDFNHFEDNVVEVSADTDYLMAKNLFSLKGHHWKSVKALISPMFTAGKLKLVFPLMDDTAQKLIKYLNKRVQDGRHHCVDGKYLAHQFTTENVANCAFGLTAQAFDSEKSEFVDVARDFGTPSFTQSLKLNILFMMPALGKYLSVGFFSKYVQNYLIDVVTQTIRYRKENNIIRNDYLDLISQLKEKSKEYKFDDRDVAAQAASFFGDGIETSSVVICYNLFEIAKHSEVQNKIREEIQLVRQKHNDCITYEAILDMTYLDCVVTETMRLDTPMMVLFKTCTKTYEFPSPKGNIPGVIVHPGDPICIPVEALHRNEEYFPEPDKFIPERFAKENKSNIKNFTYLPFGEGPRFCVGMRFGILQVKMALVHILSNFHVKNNAKMPETPLVDPGTFMRMPIGGFWFDFEPIQSKT
ncbi:cytochrome P450 9e2-like [Atheta coriaria]|uniref:cytochrome P450 9e2-like n=1 Tax=Dalotia coriaria TaxID=877792 RepID=UPI0031F40F9F